MAPSPSFPGICSIWSLQSRPLSACCFWKACKGSLAHPLAHSSKTVPTRLQWWSLLIWGPRCSGSWSCLLGSQRAWIWSRTTDRRTWLLHGPCTRAVRLAPRRATCNSGCTSQGLSSIAGCVECWSFPCRSICSTCNNYFRELEELRGVKHRSTSEDWSTLALGYIPWWGHLGQTLVRQWTFACPIARLPICSRVHQSNNKRVNN